MGPWVPDPGDWDSRPGPTPEGGLEDTNHPHWEACESWVRAAKTEDPRVLSNGKLMGVGLGKKKEDFLFVERTLK